MRRLVVAPLARADVAAALRDSRRAFGPPARSRYRRLIDAALDDLLAEPDRPGVHTIEGLDLRRYHLRNSRLHIPAADRIARPRHIIVFRYDIEQVVFARLLHDSMDFARHLDPPD